MKHTVSKTKLRQHPSILLISKVTRRSLEIIVAKEERRKGKQSDEEVFRNHSSKGRETEGLNLDSEQDFLKWDKENTHYHNMDVIYARVHLVPRKKGEGWDDEDLPVPDGHWYLDLSFCVYGFSNDVVNMLETFWRAGVGVVCDGQRVRLCQYFTNPE